MIFQKLALELFERFLFTFHGETGTTQRKRLMCSVPALEGYSLLLTVIAFQNNMT